MSSGVNASPMLRLGDEAVRRYVADGFVVLDSGLPASFHDAVAEELRFAFAREAPHLGDNVLPRIPALGELLDSPAVRGAMTSLLGEDFAWAPHRFPHNSEPLPAESRPRDFDPFENQPAMGKGSISGSGWHQDGHSRAGRSRWHTFRAANLFYFPHDVPLDMGPTRLLAGSHLYANLHGAVAEQVVLREMPAGSLVVADFDLGHAGTPNRTDASRYMVKFVALRTRHPQAPSWHCEDERWRTPQGLATPHDLPRVWTSLWNWLRGAGRAAGVDTGELAPLPALMAALESRDQGERLAALYDLIATGEAAVEPLAEALRASRGKQRHLSPAQNDPAFYAMGPDHLERRFSHRQFVPEDAAIALAAIGAEAAPVLTELLQDEDPWLRINAAYALGDMDPAHVSGVADLIGRSLDDPCDSVVRAAIDALCARPSFGPDTIARAARLLTEENPAWQQPAMGEHWSVQDQVRYALCWALLARATQPGPPEQLREALVLALNDRTGYTPAVACQALRRLGDADGLAAAVRYLEDRRWDTVNHQFFRSRSR